MASREATTSRRQNTLHILTEYMSALLYLLLLLLLRCCIALSRYGTRLYTKYIYMQTETSVQREHPAVRVSACREWLLYPPLLCLRRSLSNLQLSHEPRRYSCSLVKYPLLPHPVYLRLMCVYVFRCLCVNLLVGKKKVYLARLRYAYLLSFLVQMKTRIFVIEFIARDMRRIFFLLYSSLSFRS